MNFSICNFMHTFLLYSLIFNACLLSLKNKPTLRNILSKNCDVLHLLLQSLFEQEGVFLCLLVIWPYLPRSRIYMLSGHTVDFFAYFYELLFESRLFLSLLFHLRYLFCMLNSVRFFKQTKIKFPFFFALLVS